MMKPFSEYVTSVCRPAWPRLGRRTALLMSVLLAGFAARVPVQGAAAKTPAWVQAAAATAATSGLSEKSGAIVLLDELLIDVLPDGRRTERTRYVVKILSRDGREAAIAHMGYINRSEKVESAGAWLVRPSGAVRSYARKEFFDRAVHDVELYSEARELVLSASAEAEPGSLFAWEMVRTRGGVFPEGLWWFAGNHPVVVSRCTVRLPRGWRVEGTVFNRTGLVPVVSGQETTWEIRKLPSFVSEPWGPSSSAVMPVLAYTVFPSPDAEKKVRLRSFHDWTAVSDFIAELSDPSVVVDASIQAKADELTRGVDGELERIAAVARFVQRVNYVSIQTRLGFGGGMVPHPAPQVLRSNYGDCKDKATLMRALLRAVGIESHYVAVAYETPPIVWKEWPSPGQFNHAIIAVRVSAAVNSAAIVDDAELGRLLFFDPTDTSTCFEDLPSAYQGSPALVVAGGKGRLVDLPVLPAGASVMTRSIKARLSPIGALDASVTEESNGQEAAFERSLYLGLTAADYQKSITAWVSNGVRGARVDDLRSVDDPVAGCFKMDLNIQAAAYAQSMRDRLLVFKPVMLSRRSFTPLTAADRKHAMWIRGRTTSETVEIELPEGFKLSELGESVSLRQDFGEYDLKVSVEGRTLRLTRSLVLRAQVVPAADYGRVREFFVKMIRAEQQPCVLERIDGSG